ncbi:hypothetical protein ONS96_000425 [Cadophora gregata f. sp. sojae]|nr:hypothetical protein ONS96_010562 [Cadophora gregata f. sp. sojae]KAK0129879.1 hypothetical protein ONS96_000425 [Cadophora gregata f. sp. sojae]
MPAHSASGTSSPSSPPSLPLLREGQPPLVRPHISSELSNLPSSPFNISSELSNLPSIPLPHISSELSNLLSSPFNISSELSFLPSTPPRPFYYDSDNGSSGDSTDSSDGGSSSESDSDSQGDSDSDSDSADTIRGGLENTQYRRAPGRTRLSKGSVVEQVFEVLGHYKWSLRKFLTAFIAEDDHTYKIHLRHIRTAKQRRKMLQHALDNIGPAFSSVPLNLLRSEFKALRQTRYFGPFDIQGTDEGIDMERGFSSINEAAPIWSALLQSLLQNKRASWNAYNQGRTALLRSFQGTAIMITSMLSFAQSKKQSNYIQSYLDLYLLGSGVKRRVVEVLSGLGICHSYQTGNTTMKELAALAKTRLPPLGRNPQSIIVYDNINFQDNKRDEVLGHVKTQEAMTTAAIIICPEIPITGLTQSMHNPTVPLAWKDIVFSPGISGLDYPLPLDTVLPLPPDSTYHQSLSQSIGERITRFLIADAIRDLHPTAVRTIFQDKTSLFPSMPELDLLPVRRTEYYQFGAIFENEGTLAGTMGVHDNIFQRQLHLDPDKDFESRLWLLHGDQLTAHHIRSVKDEQRYAEKTYDRRNWHLGISAWFHIQYNLGLSLIRTHWTTAPGTSGGEHTILGDMTSWGRTAMARDSPKHYVLDALLPHSFKARVLAILYTLLSKDHHGKYTETDFSRREAYDNILSSLTPDAFLAHIESIRLQAFTRLAWDGKRPDGTKHGDPGFTTMCRYLQEIELFLTVKWGVKHGDIGMLRRCVDPLIVNFLGTHQTNYAYEMFHYRWLLKDGVCTPELQRAILASGLVNWEGRRTGFKPTDLCLEHLNGAIKIEMKCYRNSTHNTDITFNRVCTTNTAIRHIRVMLERQFGENMPGDHTSADASNDIFNKATRLMIDGLSQPRAGTLPNSLFESEDIRTVGTGLLVDRVEHFNRVYTSQVQNEVVTYLDGTAREGVTGTDLSGEFDTGDREDITNDRSLAHYLTIDDEVPGIE